MFQNTGCKILVKHENYLYSQAALSCHSIKSYKSEYLLAWASWLLIIPAVLLRWSPSGVLPGLTTNEIFHQPISPSDDVIQLPEHL